MNHTHIRPTESLLDVLADALVLQGYLILADVLPPGLTQALLQRVQQLAQYQFQHAGVGREQDLQMNPRIRRDRIHWLDAADPAEATYLEWVRELRQGLNRRLFMGLFDYEAHFAHYQPGAFYRRHLDAFRGRTNRVLTTLLYLNPDWQPGDGGELLLYPEQGEGVLERVSPRAGTLVIFLSARFPHEVLPAQADRYSIAGWFRVNNSINNQIDPPR